MKRTKIVCTIGPASESSEVLEEMIKAGMNVARLNFSHGTYEEHSERLQRVRDAASKLGVTVGVLQDIQGPKIRIGTVPGGKIALASGEKVVLTVDETDGSDGRIHVGYERLAEDVQPGNTIYLDDALIELQVVEVKGNDVICEVVIGGPLSSRKGVSLPGVEVDLPPVTDSDIEDIRFGISQGVDFIAASFVRRAEHVKAVKKVIQEAGGDVPVIAKIESQAGVNNIDEIIEASDGVMVARGDLGVEIPAEEVPVVQKMIIKKCNDAGKVVITATQMLDSMVRHPRPTRAEITDVANAILDGTDAVMLSGETAVGKYPAKAVAMMDKIARRIEQTIDFRSLLDKLEKRSGGRLSVAEAISYATCQTALKLEAAAIICSTQSGATARMVSKYRPSAPIIAVTPWEDVSRELTLSWGVLPIQVPKTENIDDMIDVSIEAALESGLVKAEDLVLFAAGVKTGEPGSTNLLQVYRVGDGS